ncbi:MAG: MotE family protein [Nitrospirota bacterium]
MLPSRRMIPWWFVVVVLSATVVWSVQATTEQPATNSLENQYVEEDYPSESRSEEATLLEDLQVRLKEVEERERGLQLREEHVRSLQQDLEALAARQAKEAKRLKKESAALSEEQRRYLEQDPALVHLLKIYESMDPEEGALRIELMREGLALDILAGIKNKKAAGILAGVNPKKAARLSEGLQKYREIKLKRPVNAKAPK